MAHVHREPYLMLGHQATVLLFEKGGVRLVLSGHEHNLLIMERNGVNYVLTGGAGEVRTGKLGGDAQADNVAWSATPHFLLCEYKAGEMHVTPYGELKNGQLQPLKNVVDTKGKKVAFPLAISGG